MQPRPCARSIRASRTGLGPVPFQAVHLALEALTGPSIHQNSLSALEPPPWKPGSQRSLSCAAPAPPRRPWLAKDTEAQQHRWHPKAVLSRTDRL